VSWGPTRVDAFVPDARWSPSEQKGLDIDAGRPPWGDSPDRPHAGGAHIYGLLDYVWTPVREVHSRDTEIESLEDQHSTTPAGQGDCRAYYELRSPWFLCGAWLLPCARGAQLAAAPRSATSVEGADLPTSTTL